MFKKNINLNKLSTILFYFSILIFIIAFNFAHNPPGGWYQQFMPDLGGRQISDIFFLDSLTGWAVTPYTKINDTAYIIKTTNGGNNWDILYTRTGAVGFARIYFLNSSTGFICGANDVFGYKGLSKSTDGGINWIQLNVPDQFVQFNDMSILNEDTIFLSSSSTGGGLFRTTNGGQNWERLFGEISGNPDKVYFYDANLGFINNGVGNNILRRTTDGGMTWTEIPGAGQYGINQIYFTDSLTGWLCTSSGGFMRKTTDAGFTWITQTLQTGGYIQSSGIGDFSNVSRDTIWGVGGYVLFPNNQGRTILHFTTNGGNNWYYQIPDTSILIFPSFINFVNFKYGWAYRNSPTGIHTKSGGDTTFVNIWQTSSLEPEEINLYQNYPNPFNPVTKIRYELQVSSYVSLKVYDMLGKEVATLVNQKQNAGSYEVEFNGGDFPSGVYLYSLITEKITITKKMLLTK